MLFTHLKINKSVVYTYKNVFTPYIQKFKIFFERLKFASSILIPLRWSGGHQREIVFSGGNAQLLFNTRGGMVINTQDTNYSIGGMVINTQDTNYSIGGMVINTQDTNFSIGGMVINTQDTNYSIGGMVLITPSEGW